MKITVTNIELYARVEVLKPLLDRADLIGYAAALNTRKFEDLRYAYEQAQQNLFNAYGQQEMDENGKPTNRLIVPFDSPNIDIFKQEMNKIGHLTHEVDIFTIPASEVIGKLTGNDILNIDWMLEK